MPDNVNPGVINFSGILGMGYCAEFFKTLKQALSESDSILISFSLIEDIDISCLQTLYAASKEARLKGKTLSFVGTIPMNIGEKLKHCGFLSGPWGSASEFEKNLIGFLDSGRPS